MKKQFINVMMTLAIVFGLSVSAMAQNGLTPATAIWHLPGSTHSLTVDATHTGTTFAWTASSVDCDGITAGTNTAPDITTANAAACVFSYPADAAGIYRFLVTETATDGGCTTVREFFTAIMDVNVVVIASNSTETAAELSGAALATCNDYTLRRTEDPTTLVGNEDTDDGGDALTTWTDAALYNERWVQVTLTTSDLTGGCAANAPEASTFDWMFNYTIAGTQYAGNATADENNFTTMDAATVLGSGTGAVSYISGANSATGVIAVEEGTTSFIIPLQSHIRWATTGTDRDQHFTFTIAGLLLSSGSPTAGNAADYTDGTESTTNAAVGNVSAEQIIHASPATPRITVVN